MSAWFNSLLACIKMEQGYVSYLRALSQYLPYLQHNINIRKLFEVCFEVNSTRTNLKSLSMLHVKQISL